MKVSLLYMIQLVSKRILSYLIHCLHFLASQHLEEGRGKETKQ